MLTASRALALAGAALLSAPATAAVTLTPGEQQALSAYGQLPAFDEVAISPDGSRLAYTGTLGDTPHVLVKNFADGRKLVDFTPAAGQKLRSINWADDQHILVTVSMTTAVPFWVRAYDEFFGAIAADIATGKAWDVLEFPGGAANNAERLMRLSGRIAARQVDGETWLYVEGLFSYDEYWSAIDDLMKINLVKRSHKLIENRERYPQFDRLFDEHGNLVSSVVYDQEHKHWWVYAGPADNLRQALSGESDIDLPDLQGLSPDGSEVWLTTWDHGQRVLATLRLAAAGQAAPASALAPMHREQWHGVLRDRRNDRVVAGVIDNTLEPRYEFVDPRLASQWQAILTKLGRVQPRIVSNSDDYSKLVVQIEAPTGPQYLFADLPTAAVITLGARYRQLPAVGDVRDIEYPAGDGLVIPAYLTLPQGRPAKNLPLIVMPHGGPEARDPGGFDWWAQALAYEGYAVLQPNYRGSTVSDAMLRAGYGQWGRKMQTDLSDGVKFLAAQGLIDPVRVCIVGASYGGYAAMAGVSLQQGIYRCAVSVGGVSDLHSMMNGHAEVRANTNLRARYFERWLGVTDLGDDSVDDRSPMHHADAVRVPLLLIHGRDDMVVPYEQSRHMADALIRLGKPCELVDLKAEDHWLSRSATRLQMLEATVSFLKEHNPPDLAAAAPAALH